MYSRMRQLTSKLAGDTQLDPRTLNAVDLENRARKLRDPNAPIRTGHVDPNDALGPQPLIINVRPGTERNWKP
jgi:hypothetical protein